ncbi:hypothetical protein CCACVL1_19269 [Corchorus capsularis]|uniref:Uncharacterized protein n=1 Tax=Corchorus capsularis TaxID=210143 RepID=A0A1R3HHM9_COCAP|nr:hypothetical protein CCACVL1_19269 [Corchorus capsularis]
MAYDAASKEEGGGGALGNGQWVMDGLSHNHSFSGRERTLELN